MRTQRIVIAIICVLSVLAIALVAVFSREARFIENEDSAAVQRAFELLDGSLTNPRYTYVDFLRDSQYPAGESEYYAVSGARHLEQKGNMLAFPSKESLSYSINVEKAGLYSLDIEFAVEQYTLSALTFQVFVNGETQYEEMNTVGLRLLFTDDSKSFPLNSFGDQMPPLIKRSMDAQTEFFYNNDYDTAAPMLFYLQEGENVVELVNVSQDCIVGRLRACAPVEIPTYESYISAHNGSPKVSDDARIEIEATGYVSKSSTSVALGSMSSVTVSPVHHEQRLLNIVGLDGAGATVTYELEAAQAGLYAIAMNIQTSWADSSDYVSLRIDGEIPFAEFANYHIAGKKANGDCHVHTVANAATNEPYYVYLTEGAHSLSLTLEKEPAALARRNLQLVIDHINEFTLEIKKITGKDIDTSRSWNFTRYIPQTEAYLRAYKTLLTDAAYQMQQKSDVGMNSQILSTVSVVFKTIDKLLEYPNDLPLHLDALSTGASSVLQIAGDFYSGIDTQHLTIDKISLAGDPARFTENSTNTLDALVFGGKVIATTFTSERYNPSMDDSVLNIWVAGRPITQIDLMQQLADADFTPKTGIPVKFSIMPDANVLVMSAAAGTTPDVAMGLLSHIPYELSSRGALSDLTQHPDFWEVAGWVPPGTFVPFLFNGGVYAFPESLELNMLVYRKDIFESLQLTPPDTWQDVIDMLPELQRYGMNFFHPVASGSGYKWIYQTGPMIMQHNGKMFTDDGLYSRLNEPEAVAGIGFLGELFTKYSLPADVPSFFDAFKYGRLPIGIANAAMYRQLRSMAPELEGQWGSAPTPGVLQEDGSVSRWYLGNQFCSLAFKDSGKEAESWELLKWWMTAETQMEYIGMLTASFGEDYLWISANLDAFDNVILLPEHKDAVLEQIQWIQDVQRTPGQYVLERSVSDIWNQIVFQGVSPQVATDKMSIGIQRELRRKMQEFGFIDESGESTKEYVLNDIDWIIQQIEGAKSH